MAFINSLNKYILSIYIVPGTVPGARLWEALVNKTEKVPTLIELTFQWEERRQGNK